jgi:hypothetical protein
MPTLAVIYAQVYISMVCTVDGDLRLCGVRGHCNGRGVKYPYDVEAGKTCDGVEPAAVPEGCEAEARPVHCCPDSWALAFRIRFRPSAR